jgi:hypothetical protein
MQYPSLGVTGTTCHRKECPQELRNLRLLIQLELRRLGARHGDSELRLRESPLRPPAPARPGALAAAVLSGRARLGANQVCQYSNHAQVREATGPR